MIPRTVKSLPTRMENFCRAYVVHYNGPRAVMEAGYSPAAAGVQSSQLLARPEVKERIAQLLKPKRQAIEVNQERVIQELSAIAFGNVKELYDEMGRLKPIHELEDHVAATIAEVHEETRIEGRGEDAETVRTKKVKSWDKMKALEMLAKHFKMYTDAAQVTTNVQTNVQAITVNDLRTLPAEEAALLRQLAESRARRSEASPADAGSGEG